MAIIVESKFWMNHIIQEQVKFIHSYLTVNLTPVPSGMNTMVASCWKMTWSKWEFFFSLQIILLNKVKNLKNSQKSRNFRFSKHKRIWLVHCFWNQNCFLDRIHVPKFISDIYLPIEIENSQCSLIRVGTHLSVRKFKGTKFEVRKFYKS